MNAYFLFISLIQITACSFSDQSRLVKHERYNYQFEIPNDWTFDKDYVSIDIYPPLDSTSRKQRASMHVSTDTTYGKTIDECFDFLLGEKYEEQFSGYSKVDQGRTTINGLSAIWLEHSCLKGSKSDESYILLVYLIYTESRLYVITARAKSQFYQQYELFFEKIIKSFKVL